MRARFSPYAQPQAAMTTAADAPNGTERINAMSTVGMEISASTTTTDVDASAPERDTMAATNSSPIAAATTTVSTAIMRFVREPAISQLSTSAPVPSVPNGCAADGEAHALNPLVSSSEYGVHTRDRADTSSHAPMTISAYLPPALAQMVESTVFMVAVDVTSMTDRMGLDVVCADDAGCEDGAGFDAFMLPPFPKRRRNVSTAGRARGASDRPRDPAAGRTRPAGTVRFALRSGRGCRRR